MGPNEQATWGVSSTDYVVRSATRSPGGLVVYVIVDRRGRITNLAVPYRDSVPDLVEEVLRRTVAQYPAGRRRA